MYMRRALDLAAQGSGFTYPNPMVGAVLVHDGRILAEGYHHRAGEPHAEIMALNNLGAADRSNLPQATMYVTLEPCSHRGRTGPCCLALIEQGVGRVVVALEDPNPLVSGRGISMLREAGCRVEVGIEAERAEQLNRAFLSSFRRGRPWVVLKWAADANGAVDGPRSPEHPGPWTVTGSEAQITSHRLRQRCGALLVGAGTWLADRTRGSVRALAGPEIARILWASRPLAESDRLRAEQEGWTMWSPDAGEDSAHALERHLAHSTLRSVLVEGGPKTLKLFLDSRLWDEAYKWSSPRSLPAGGPPEPSNNLVWQHVGRYGGDELQVAVPVTPNEHDR